MKKIIFALPVILLQASLYAEETVDVPPAPDQGLYQTLVMIAIALLFFYFILWRPEQKRRKAMEEQRSSLKQGDRVTAMGIVGTIVKIGDSTIILKMVDGGKIEVLKGAVTDVLPSITDAEEFKKE
jgi:preprotein translocase subunit YajC